VREVKDKTSAHPSRRKKPSPDGSFITYVNGIVYDTKTGLEWVAGPDRNTTWGEANDWVASLNIDGGGWRMPSIDELRPLYERGGDKRNVNPLFKYEERNDIWSGETKRWWSRLPCYLELFYGRKICASHKNAEGFRVLAVRSRNDR
jgi:hypothetical protein